MSDVTFGNDVFLLPVIGRGEVLQIPRNVQSRNITPVNDAFKRNDMIDLHSFRTFGINREQFERINPCWSAAFNIFPAVVQASGIHGVSCPSFPSSSIDFGSSSVVKNFLLLRDFLSVRLVRGIARFAPVVLIFTVFAKVFWSATVTISKRANFAQMANCAKFLVVLGAGFINATGWANLAYSRLWSRLHNSDIIAHWGDIKQGEFGER